MQCCSGEENGKWLQNNQIEYHEVKRECEREKERSKTHGIERDVEELVRNGMSSAPFCPVQSHAKAVKAGQKKKHDIVHEKETDRGKFPLDTPVSCDPVGKRYKKHNHRIYDRGDQFFIPASYAHSYTVA